MQMKWLMEKYVELYHVNFADNNENTQVKSEVLRIFDK